MNILTESKKFFLRQIFAETTHCHSVYELACIHFPPVTMEGRKQLTDGRTDQPSMSVMKTKTTSIYQVWQILFLCEFAEYTNIIMNITATLYDMEYTTTLKKKVTVNVTFQINLSFFNSGSIMQRENTKGNAAAGLKGISD